MVMGSLVKKNPALTLVNLTPFLQWVFEKPKGEWGKKIEEERRNPIAADGGEDVEVARVNEVENDGVEGTLAFLEPVGDPVLPLPRRR